MPRKNEKKIVYGSSSHVSGPDGLYNACKETVFRIGAEEDYIKIYFDRMYYLSDLPSDCFRLLLLLLPHVNYAEDLDSPTVQYSLTIILNPDLKKRITKVMGYTKVDTVSNLITELCDGEILHRVSRSIYRLNPYIFGRGQYKNIVHLREDGEFPFVRYEETFMLVRNRNKELRKRKREHDQQRKRNNLIDDADTPIE